MFCFRNVEIAYTRIFSDNMSKLPSRATISKSRSLEELSVENVHVGGILQSSFKILISVPLISISNDFLCIISHYVPSAFYSNPSIILNEILPYYRLCSVR
jgi:hypothetical protein